jgi:hypothetical protein
MSPLRYSLQWKETCGDKNRCELIHIRAIFSPKGIASRLARPASGRNPMVDTTDPLVLDLVEWIAREPRLYSEVIETWRTSCPRLTIWEDAVDRGYVVREAIAGFGIAVTATADGERLLRDNGRAG